MHPGLGSAALEAAVALPSGEGGPNLPQGVNKV